MTNAFLFVMPRNIRNIKDGKGNLAATLLIFELTPVLSIYCSDTFRSHSNHPHYIACYSKPRPAWIYPLLTASVRKRTWFKTRVFDWLELNSTAVATGTERFVISMSSGNSSGFPGETCQHCSKCRLNPSFMYEIELQADGLQQPLLSATDRKLRLNATKS